MYGIGRLLSCTLYHTPLSQRSSTGGDEAIVCLSGRADRRTEPGCGGTPDSRQLLRLLSESHGMLPCPAGSSYLDFMVHPSTCALQNALLARKLLAAVMRRSHHTAESNLI